MECDGLGIGLFIVREALGILGHRIEVASTTCRGSRFSIFVERATKTEGLSTDKPAPWQNECARSSVS
jgi:K+-sensing histidine kinase KdpD